MRRTAKEPRAKPSHRKGLSRAELAAIIEAATVDCYNESEETTGWLTAIQGGLAVPFETRGLGVEVTVQKVALDASGQIVPSARGAGPRQALPILDLPLPSRAPQGAEWIQAYRQWLGRR